jgi:hypothetical protein
MSAPQVSHRAVHPGNIFPHFGQMAWSRRRIVLQRGQIAAAVPKPQTTQRRATPAHGEARYLRDGS